MGLNTTVLILNDYLGEIAKDQDFGRKLNYAANENSHTPFARGAHIAAMNHSGDMSLILVGGNTSEVLLTTYGCHHTPEDIARKLADSLGFKLIRKPVKRRKKAKPMMKTRRRMTK